MLNDSDIKNLTYWCVNKHLVVKRSKYHYKQILDLLAKELNKNPDLKGSDSDDKTMISLRQKYFRGLQLIVEKVLEGHSQSSAIDILLTKESYQDEYTVSFYHEAMHREPTEYHEKQIFLQLKSIEQHNAALKIEKALYKVSDDLKSGDFTGVEKYNMLYNQLYNQLNKIKKDTEKKIVDTGMSKFIIGEDDSQRDENFRMASKLKYDRTKKTPTGFEFLDDLLTGGFERQTLSIFAGNPGSGKSTILLNFIRNAALYNRYIKEVQDQFKLYFYISVENSELLTRKRLTCLHDGITSDQYERQLNNEDVYEKLNKDIKEFNTKMIFIHHQPETLTVNDIEAMVDDVIDSYRDKTPVICGIYVDYLDELKCDDPKIQQRRFMIRSITNQLKELSKTFNCPVITATQLNRESFTIKQPKDLNNSMMSESLFHVRIAEFVAALGVNPDTDQRNVFFKVTKNRDGKVGYHGNFSVDFEKSTFLNCTRETNFDNAKNSSELLFSLDESKLL